MRKPRLHSRPPNRTILELKRVTTNVVSLGTTAPNRTILELKQSAKGAIRKMEKAPNRTILELKHAKPTNLNYAPDLQIAPYWN